MVLQTGKWTERAEFLGLTGRSRGPKSITLTNPLMQSHGYRKSGKICQILELRINY